MNKIALVFEGTLKNDARVLREVTSLAEKWDVDVFSSKVNLEDQESVPTNVKVTSYVSNQKWLYRNIFFGKKYHSLLKIIDPFDYCALICIDYPTLELGYKLKRINPKLKLIYDSHEIYIETINQFFPRSGWKKIYGVPLIKINQFLHSKKEKIFIQSVDIKVTVCESLRKYFLKKLRADFLVLRNCPSLTHIKEINEEEKSSKRADFNIANNDFLLLYQGDINPGRGLSIMLDVMKQLPSNFKFIIIGDGMLLQSLKDKCKNESIKNVRFLGRISYKDLMTYTQIADLGINLIEPINESKRLSLPNKLFEYMSVGVPFLSNDLPEPRVLVEEYKCGVLVDYSNKNNIAESIISLSEDKDFLSTLGNNGKKAINEDLNWSIEFEKLLSEKEIVNLSTFS
ncbi:MAG: glycosyltransferase family 4 protein [Brumimicrobium sp.]